MLRVVIWQPFLNICAKVKNILRSSHIYHLCFQEECDCLVQDHGDFKGCGGHVPSSFIGYCQPHGTHLSEVDEQSDSHHWPSQGSFNLT